MTALLPPPSPRTALHIAFDIGDVGIDLCILSDELKRDDSNLAYIARRIEAEIKRLGELLVEMGGQRLTAPDKLEVDHDCYELARDFIGYDGRFGATEVNIMSMAMAVQTAIEDWFLAAARNAKLEG